MKDRVVASKYCLLHELGHGGMGTVWLAEHLTLRSPVAVKLIDPRLAASSDALRRFEREARAAAALRSPHVVQVFDFGVDRGSPYLAMELLSGESLAQRLERDGSLPPDEAWTALSQVGRAMERAHELGFVHRDLKPDNIFLVRDEPRFFVKVLDFGIAKAFKTGFGQVTDRITQSGILIGTPHHMSPEQAEGRKVDARSDLWSMGVVAFECVTGQLPFDGSSLPALLKSICYDPIVVPSEVARVPPGFDAWFARAVARDVEHRFQTVGEFMKTLEPLLAAPAEEWEITTTYRPGIRSLRSIPARIETFPGRPPERREDVRVPSSIPAGIDGMRDLRHTALIYNASRGGALLVTRHRCHPGEVLRLSLQVNGPHHGSQVAAQVVRVAARRGDSVWTFEVGVQFEAALSEELLREIERH